MIRKRIKNKIKNFELLKKKEGKKLANIGVITLLLLSVLSTLFLPYASPAFIADEVVTDDFTGSNWNVTDNVVHNATGGYISVKSDYGAGLKEGNAWWYPEYHSYPITNLTLQVNYTGEIDQTGSNLGSNEIFINITLTNETGTTTSSPQVMVHHDDFDTTYNETYTWNVVDIYQYRYVNISFYMAANATTDNLAWVTVRWLKLSIDDSEVYEDFTTWTEVDNANDTINVIDSHNVNVNVTRSDATYLYKDFGNYTNFSGKFTFKANEMKDTTFPLVGLILFTNTTGGMLATKTSKAIQTYLHGELFGVKHYNSSSGAWDVVSHNITIGNKYYVVFEKSGNDITLHCYNDTLLSDLYFTLSLYLYQPSVNYRYVETAVGTQLTPPDATPEWVNVTISNLNFSIAPSDTEDITIYNPSVNNTFIFNNEYNEYTNVSVSSTAGTFRVYMYWNDSGTWRSYYDSGPGQSNGTFSAQNYNIPYNGSLFEWAVNVTADSGLYYRNQTFSFYSFDVNKPSCYDDDLSKYSPENDTAYYGSSIGRGAVSSIFDGNNTVYVFYINNRVTGTNEQISIRPYYINNQTWGSIYRFSVSTYPLKDGDNHVWVVATLDKYNHIWVVAGGHADASNPIYSFRSNHSISNPSFDYASVNEWVNGSGFIGKDIITTVSDSSYQKIWVGWNNTYAVFMRSGGLTEANSNMTLFWSFDNGTTWDSRIISDDEFYSMSDWKYDYGEDILFLTRWYVKFTTGNTWANNYVSFFYITLNDTINNNGAYASNQTPADTPYYSFPVHGTDIASFDNFTSTLGLSTTASRTPVFYDTDKNEIYLFLNKDRASTSTNFAKLAYKTLGTSKLWNEATNVSKIGDGIMVKNKIAKIHDDYYLVPLTEWNGVNWELKLAVTTNLSDVDTYKFRKITTTINESGDSPDNWVQENINTFSYGNFTILTGDYDYDSWTVTRYMYMAYINDMPTNQPPTVTITSPSEGADIIGNINITGTASDTDGTIQSVFVKIDSDSWQLATGTTSWSYAYNTTGLSDGAHTIYAKSFDGKDYSAETKINITFSATGFTDSGTAEPMTFPDTLPNSGIWVNATSNLLVITNNYGTVDGTNSWIKLQSAIMYNETNDEIIYGGTNGIRLHVRINDGSWHNITERDGDGYYILNDSVWNYTFGEGDTLTIKEEVYIQDCAGCDPAGYYTSYYMNKYYPGFWQVVNSTSNMTSLNYWNATITLTNVANTPPIVPNTPDPANDATDVTINNPSLSFHTGDTDSNYLQCSLYLNDSLVNSKYVENLTSNMTISIAVPQILEAGKTYSWYVKVSDGTDTVTGPVWQFTTANATSNQAPLVYSPSPTNGATNISLLPTLSVLVYDTDSDSISVTFYDSNNITIGIDTFVNQMPPSPGQASVQWNNVILSNHTYEWYAVANDGDGNVVRYPTTGYLNFTTGITYPPVITFQVKDTSGFPLYDVNISCSNLNQQILQYATTNTGGFASFSFNYNDIGQTYDFVFKKTNYTTVKKTYTISTGQYYITLQYKATPTGDDTTNPTDIATIFVNYAQGNLGSTGLAFLSIILVILAMLIASKQFNTGNTTTLFIGASLFGLFIAIGWIPFWLLLLPFVIVALMFGGKIRDIIFGKSTGGDES